MHEYTIAVPERLSNVYPLNSGYDVPRWKWLTKVMRKLRLLKTSYHTEFYTNYKRVTIRTSSAKQLVQQVMMHYRREWNRKIVKLYVGTKFFDDLGYELDALHDALKFPEKLYGAWLIVTPHLEGMMPVFEGEE